MNKEQMSPTSLTIKLLRAIGSPFASEQKHELPENKDEALKLYNYATKNKIGLAYLESLKDQDKLEELGLELKYQAEAKKHNEQLITARRISKLLNSFDINYAIFKSIMPFPATPNDVDIIHFGSAEEGEKVAEIILQSDYMEVKGEADAEQRMFHDIRYTGYLNPHPRKKDVYDVDLYQIIAASHVIYLDKRKIEKYVTELNMSSNKFKVLGPEAELMAIIIHSILEMLCTLFVYYATLHHLLKMNSEEISRFIDIAKENNVTFAVRNHCSLIAELHQAAHGFVPEKIEKVLAELGDETNERKNLLKNNFKMPHKYSMSTIIRTLLEKGKEREFRKSAVKQMVYMSNPKHLKWVVKSIIVRRRRGTY